MRIQLINPPTPQRYLRCTRSGCFPPLDLLSLASYVQVRRPNASIEILDGDLLSLEDIVSRLDAHVIGISPKVLSYETAMIVARAAYASGSRVIVGGALVSAMPGPVLRNRPSIEAVCIDDGEESLLAFVNGMPLSKVPNIVYRDGSSIVVGNFHRLDLDDLPVVNYGMVDVDVYMANYRARFADHPFTRPLSYYSHKGCHWHDVSGGCIFCRRQPPQSIRRSPSLFWLSVKEMVDQFGADLVWDVSDTFTAPRQWVQEIARAKPKDVKCKFYVYGRASDLDEKMVGLLKYIGCFEILIGVESGNDAILKRANKGITCASILRAVELCSLHGIQVFPTFLFGLPGETNDSLNDTLALAQSLISYGNVREISSAVLLPLPGSRVFSQLSKRLDSPAWLSDSDTLDPPRIQAAYTEHFTHVSVEDLEKAKTQLDSLVAPEYRSSFGGMSSAPGLLLVEGKKSE